jgi:hypothetical protein
VIVVFSSLLKLVDAAASSIAAVDAVSTWWRPLLSILSSADGWLALYYYFLSTNAELEVATLIRRHDNNNRRISTM